MVIGILINARLGSTRLRQKHLLSVNEKPLLLYLIERIKAEFAKEITAGETKLIIATSDEPENRQFEQFSVHGAAAFYGSIHNIPLRHLQAAQEFGLDAIISVDGDDILCSTAGMRLVYQALAGGSPYVKTSGLPFGMNSWGYSQEFLARSMEQHQNDILETGWGRVFDSTRSQEIPVPSHSEDSRLRFTLDYQGDYDFFKAVIKRTGETTATITDDCLVKLVLDEKLYEFNEEISREYWANFHKNVEAEKSKS